MADFPLHVDPERRMSLTLLPCGAVDDGKVKRILALGKSETPLCLIPVRKP